MIFEFPFSDPNILGLSFPDIAGHIGNSHGWILAPILSFIERKLFIRDSQQFIKFACRCTLQFRTVIL